MHESDRKAHPCGKLDQPHEWDGLVSRQVEVDLKALTTVMRPEIAKELPIPPPAGLIIHRASERTRTSAVRMIAEHLNRLSFSLTLCEVPFGVADGSAKGIREVFARGRGHAPSILTFDEMDALFPCVPEPMGHHDVKLVENVLIEISALKAEDNVFLVGTTNCLNCVDPRILRNGRFTDRIEAD